MERLEGGRPFSLADWAELFAAHGGSWRDIDYRELDRLFNLRTLTGSMLDVGCALGDGVPTLRAKDRDRTLSCCDFSPEAMDVVRSRFPDVEAFVHDVARPLPGTWDHVVCLQTIEHLEDPVTAVRNLAAASRDSLIIGVPYRNRRPDDDHRWSFDEHDFADVFDHHLISPTGLNIYWYRSSARVLRTAVSRRLRHDRERLRQVMGRAGR